MKRLILILLIISSSAQAQRQYLKDWAFRSIKEQTYYTAEVPGTVHTDLYANKLIDDPFFGTNEYNIQWIEKEEWEYKTTFGSDKIHEKSELVFEGLDTYADIFINGRRVLSADNMFREWRIPLRGIARNGTNELTIIFRPPSRIEDSLSAVLYKNTGIKEIPGGNRVFTRKAAYHYGWDWSPRFVTCGIWRPVYIESYENGRIKNIQTVQEIFDDRARVTFNAECENAEGKTLVLLLDGREISRAPAGGTLAYETVNPRLWWTNGLGEPYLYRFKILLKDNNVTLDEKNLNVGLRTIELVRGKDEKGESFFFRLNGVPVFMKGANFIPADNFLPRVSRDKYSFLVKEAAASNFNMLRVWGGGVYEDDSFYDLCDESGILVWQDFMFACSMVPADENFFENVKREAAYNIKRLRNHSCIALWCGNNEADEGWHNWGWQNNLTDAQKKLLWNAYEKIFTDILPETVYSLHKNSNYVSTSPKHGWGRKESLTDGDCHYWGVWWGMEPFETYHNKVGRFMSEYGFQGFPSLNTIRKFSGGENMYPGSDVMKAHQKHPVGYETIEKYMEMYYDIPTVFADYIKTSQLLQAMGIRKAIEAHRRAMPYCMGTLYWQFNDCNPVVSWSGIDYFGGKKLLQEYVKEAYADILVSPAEENGKLRVYVVSDRLTETKGTLEIKIQPFTGILPGESYLTGVVIKPNSSEILFEKSIHEIIKKFDRYTNYLTAALVTEDGKIYSNEFLFCKPKEIQIVK